MPSRKAAAHAVLLQKRILTVITALVVLSFAIWILSIGTDYWTVVDCETPSQILKTKKYLVNSHAGIWRRCMNLFTNATKSAPANTTERCVGRLFLMAQKTNITHLHYNRSIAAFSVISICMLLMAIAFSIYSFRYTRYMYKRMAALGHFMGAGCVLIVLEVTQTAAYYSAEHLPARHPPGCEWHFGFSFGLGWLTFTVELIAGFFFLLFSRKRKKDKAPDREFAIDEEPTIIRR